jgi:DNA-binding PadR family transcriptional regulator
MAIEKRMDCVILGFLSHEPLTGYEIKKRVDTTLKYFWSASYGSIYPTLNHLENENKVTRLETKENGRDKIIYTITDIGQKFLRNWLCVPVEKDELRYETLLKLFFGGDIGQEQTIKHIKAFEKKINAELPYLKGAVKQLENIKDTEVAHIYYLLTAKFGVKTFEAYLEWCAEAITALQGGN